MLNPTDIRSQQYLCQIIGTGRIMEENKEEEEKFSSEILELYHPINFVDLLRLNLYRMSFNDYSTNINDENYSDYNENLSLRYQIQLNACENGITDAISFYLNNWKSFSSDIYYYYELCLLLSLASTDESTMMLIQKILNILDAPVFKSKTPNYEYIRGCIVVFQLKMARNMKNV